MLIPVILSGGSGTRLWPVSRESFPKPFMKLDGDRSLLQRTLQRALPLCKGGRAVIVTNHEYQFKTREEVAALALPRDTSVTRLLEPVGRNTAPAIAIAALWAEEVAPGATLLVLPADHLIPDEQAFCTVAGRAIELASAGSIVLFGIRPTGPETGFGYIEATPGAINDAREVIRFVEKPDAARAAQFLQAGNFYWNSGMFAFRADRILAELRGHCPQVLDAAQAAWLATRARDDAGKVEIDAASFSACPDISIDYAVMERAADVKVVPSAFGWSDIGSWKAVAEQFDHDDSGNTSVGETILVDTRNTHVQSEGRLVATVGVDNLLVVDTPDALLVAARDASQQVKEVVARLRRNGHETARSHRTVARPWGAYTVLHQGPRFKIKSIVVNPREQLSLQMHHHRSEHWIVVSGTARITCGDDVRLIAANESTYIPIGERHRLENPGVIPLVIIEVQCGDYLGEDDIVRFSDVYGRTPAQGLSSS